MSYNQLLTHPSTHVGTRAQDTHGVTTPSTSATTEPAGALPQSHPGLCGTPTVYRGCPHKDTRGTPVPKQARPWVARRNLHEDDQRRTTTRHRQASRETCFQSQDTDTHLGTYMVAEPVRETGDLRRVEHVVNRIEVETSRFLKEIVQRNGTNQPGEDHPGDRVHQDSTGSAHRRSR